MPTVRTIDGEEYTADIIRFDNTYIYLLNNVPTPEQRIKGRWLWRKTELVLTDKPQLVMLLNKDEIMGVDFLREEWNL